MFNIFNIFHLLGICIYKCKNFTHKRFHREEGKPAALIRVLICVK